MYILLFFVLGLCTGSFSNVVIYRLPEMMFNPPVSRSFNLATPRSHCPACQHTLGILQLIPLLSWLAQGGRCHFCKMKISAIYLSVELLTGLLYLAIALCIPDPFIALPLTLFCSTLIILAAIDLRHMLLPDVLTLPLLWAGLLWSCSGYGFLNAQQAITGAIMGYLSLWGTYWLYLLLRKREGLGYGDFKLNAALGAWFGAEGILFILIVGSLLGIILWWYRCKSIIPFGPALSGAAMIYLAGLISPPEWQESSLQLIKQFLLM